MRVSPDASVSALFFAPPSHAASWHGWEESAGRQTEKQTPCITGESSAYFLSWNARDVERSLRGTPEDHVWLMGELMQAVREREEKPLRSKSQSSDINYFNTCWFVFFPNWGLVTIFSPSKFYQCTVWLLIACTAALIHTYAIHWIWFQIVL